MPWDEGTGITPHWGLGAAAAKGWQVAQGCILHLGVGVTAALYDQSTTHHRTQQQGKLKGW